MYSQLFKASPVPTLVFRKIGNDIILSDYSLSASDAFTGISPEAVNRSVAMVFSDYPEIQTHILSCFSIGNGAKEAVASPSAGKILYGYMKFKFTFFAPDVLMVQADDSYNDYQLLETELRENKERLELALLASGAGLWDWDISTGKVIFGEKWTGMLGYAPGELKGHISTWEKLIHPDDKEMALERIDAHLNGETKQYRTEHRLLNKKGEWVWVLDMGKVVGRDTKGHPIRMVGTQIDITKPKKVETDLKYFNAKLETMVKERTHQLKQKENLLIKKKQALQIKSTHLEEANSALKLLLRKGDENRKELEDNMVANINELVAPYLEKIGRSKLNDTQRVSLEIIKSNLDQIVSPFSRRLTSKYMNLTPAEINVANLIKHGKTSKEIADLMCLSVKTIDTQRRSIRKKVGIRCKHINLRTYLHALKQ